MKGLGVLTSLNMGRLIATFEPRRRRILAVRVLHSIDGVSGEDLRLLCAERADIRETNVWVCYFIGKEQAVARLSVRGVVIGVGERSWGAETRIGCDGYGCFRRQ